MMYLFLAIGDQNFFHHINPLWVLSGSLFPDADHKHAPAGKILPLWLFFKHRGFTHTIFGMVGFSSLVGLLNPWWAISFGFGYFTHLLLDCLTPSGVNWLGKKKSPNRRG